MNPMFVHI